MNDERPGVSTGAAQRLNLNRPNSARMYDYFLGGATNFEVDREAAEQVPFAGTWARSNRGFLERAVRYLVNVGIEQFLDLGSGIPTVGNVHEIAHRYAPSARVAYVDNESIAVAHARELLGDNPLVTVTQADIRFPSEVLAAKQVAGLLDFSRPVAVLAVGILHFIADDPAELMAQYRDACVPGSYLVVSHGSPEIIHEELGEQEYRRVHETFARTPTPLALRSPEEIRGIFEGYTLVEPGMVRLNEWRPDRPCTPQEVLRSSAYGLVGWLNPRSAQ